MPHYMIFTSMERTLIGGSGYGIAAQTQHFPRLLSEELTRLAGYTEIFPSSNPASRFNPFNYFHVQLSQWHVVGLIRHTENDYSGRSNYICHFLALGGDELPEAGPVALLQNFPVSEKFKGEARVLAPISLPKTSNLGPSVCRLWKESSGDAGWAGVLAQKLMDRHNVNILYGNNLHGNQALAILAEAFALMPVEDRWAVTFSTHVEGFPKGNAVRLAMLQDGASMSRDFKAQSDCWNLTKHLTGGLASGPLVNLARGNSRGITIGKTDGTPGFPAPIPIVTAVDGSSSGTPLPPPVARRNTVDVFSTRPTTIQRTSKTAYIFGLLAAMLSLLVGLWIGTAWNRPELESQAQQLASNANDIKEMHEKMASNDAKMKADLGLLKKQKDDWKQKADLADKEKLNVEETSKKIQAKLGELQKEKDSMVKKNEKPKDNKKDKDDHKIDLAKLSEGPVITNDLKKLLDKYKGTQMDHVKTVFDQMQNDKTASLTKENLTKMAKDRECDFGQILRTKDFALWSRDNTVMRKYFDVSMPNDSYRSTATKLARNETSTIDFIDKTKELAEAFSDQKKSFLVYKKQSGNTINVDVLRVLATSSDKIIDKINELVKDKKFGDKEASVLKFKDFLEELHKFEKESRPKVASGQ